MRKNEEYQEREETVLYCKDEKSGSPRETAYIRCITAQPNILAHTYQIIAPHHPWEARKQIEHQGPSAENFFGCEMKDSAGAFCPKARLQLVQTQRLKWRQLASFMEGDA